MRTITEQRTAITGAILPVEEAVRVRTRQGLLLSTETSTIKRVTFTEYMRRRQVLADAIDTALAEVPKVCRERIDMWSKVIAQSSDDDEIRDAQAAQSELRWLLLQLEGDQS